MKVLEGHPAGWRAGIAGQSAVTIGVFDGVHLGHQKVLSALAASSRQTVVVTFDQHPLRVVAPEAAPRLLTSLEQRIERFAEFGIDVVGILPFREVRNLSPEEFVEVVIVQALSAEIVAAGTDFRFGLNRAGDVVLLGALGRKRGFRLLSVPPVTEDGQPISSTSLRIMVASGRVAEAAAGLGRLFEVRGRVERGEGRGRKLGIPTANLDLDPVLLVPGRGVYAAWADSGAGFWPAAVNVGVRPTFAEDREVVEVHVLDFDGDLYDRELAVRFQSRIRDERAFAGAEQLVEQVHRDIEEARTRLKQSKPP